MEPINFLFRNFFVVTIISYLFRFSHTKKKLETVAVPYILTASLVMVRSFSFFFMKTKKERYAKNLGEKKNFRNEQTTQRIIS